MLRLDFFFSSLKLNEFTYVGDNMQFKLVLFITLVTSLKSFGSITEIRSDYKKNEITSLCNEAVEKNKKTLNEIVELKEDERTLNNTLLKFEYAMGELSDLTAPLTFMGYVLHEKELLDEGAQCEEKLGQYGVEVFTKRDLYLALKQAQTTNLAENRLKQKTLEQFEDNALNLSDEKLKEYQELKSKLASLEAEFSKNLNQDNSVITLTKAELVGVPEDFIENHKKVKDLYIITTKPTDYDVVTRFADLASTREKMLKAYVNRQAEPNTKLFNEAIVIRQKLAKLKGFKNWADERTYRKMAKNSANVLKFLNDLKSKLTSRNRSDLAELLKAKKLDQPKATQLDPWDINYYHEKLLKTKYQVDSEKIKDYFPSEQTVQAMFQVYSKLLGVEFKQIKDAKVWDPSVQFYEIIDLKTKETLAYFYADFIPRPNKYGHAAAFNLISGFTDPITGKYHKPISAIVANFNPPTANKPSLLYHHEVETLFHEFGHIMHQTLTQAPYSSLSGSAVTHDFVEAPSQMLENWVWNEKILKMISGLYSDPTQKLEPEMIKKMLAAKNFGQGTFYTRQLALALFDMRAHTSSSKVDVTQLYNNTYREIIGLKPVEGGHFAASFGHMLGGYDAGYYGYLWSEVYALDMFSKFQQDEDLLSAKTGALYRKSILEKGNMEEAIDLLKEFLGREPSQKAFLRYLGIQ